MSYASEAPVESAQVLSLSADPFPIACRAHSCGGASLVVRLQQLVQRLCVELVVTQVQRGVDGLEGPAGAERGGPRVEL